MVINYQFYRAMTGLVLKTTGGEYVVRSDAGDFVCRVKGSFRIKGIKSTNPLAVGDVVEFDADAGYITALKDRRNWIVRKPTNLSKQQHIIAANVDRTFIVVTVKEPVTAPEFIDRYLATAEAYRIPAVVVFNKVDLLDDEEMEYLSALEWLYNSVGYKTVRVAATEGMGIDTLREMLAGKITLLSGNSGVGKSTIINLLVPGVSARVGAVSASHHTGMHTTTFSEMYALPEGGGYVIDTPGIKSFGTFDMKPDEVSHYFPEIFREAAGCRFADCTHTHEPGCAVLAAVEEHRIAESRYQSYLSIRGDLAEGKYRE